ncbi:MAG: amino acid permease [Chloroflexota bacterium]|jgi:amino acid transporter/nucleotide-binding universal stress UspA family protein
MATQSQADEITLSRTLSLLDITMIGVGAMIGAGIFVLTGIAAGHAGPALTIAFLLNGIVTTFTALSYAELGSSFPEAGGGYLWVKEGMSGTQGFLAGWMSWFAHAVACSLYALGFGRFAYEIWHLAGLPDFGLSQQVIVLIFMVAIVILFSFINYRGASEAGTVGNFVTIAKVLILVAFIGFGLWAMWQRPESMDVFKENLMPNGIGGVFLAMALTFIAFEGYEIIAQSGEEVINPMRNVPRAIFISIIVVVIVYVLVAFVAIGATTQTGGLPVWEYLSNEKEVAIVRAAENFMPAGGLLILISGLASTMSALNATIYSSSRVSFAMGRDHNLPEVFGRIHPKMHTPHWAIFLSGILIIAMALSLPIEEVAAAADIMFLLMFAQVNITVMTLRRRRPDLARGYWVPFFPWPPVIGIITNLLLAGFLAYEIGRVGLVSAAWIVAGVLLYWGYFRLKEETERPKEILMEEALVSVDYTVLVPVANVEQAAQLGRLGCALAKEHNGGVLALHVVKVPPQLSLSDGRFFLKEGRPPLQEVIEQARELDVPVHTMIRLGRDISEAILKTLSENSSDIILFGWPGTSGTNEQLFGSVIDRIVANPPANIAIFRDRPYGELRRIVVPIAGGPNSRLSVNVALALARNTPEETEVVLVNVIVAGVSRAQGEARARNAFRHSTHGLDFPFVEQLVEADTPVEGILQAAKGSDLVVIGATKEPMFRNLLMGNVAQQVAEGADCPVIITKRQSTMVNSMLRETVLEPITRSDKLPEEVESADVSAEAD